MDARQRAEDALAKLDEFVEVHVPDLRSELLRLIGSDDEAGASDAEDAGTEAGSEVNAGRGTAKRAPKKAPAASTGG